MVNQNNISSFGAAGSSLRSAVSAGGSDEEVFPPKTLEKLKKIIQLSKRKSKGDSTDNGNREVKKSEQKESQNLSSTKNEEKIQVETKMVPVQEIVSAM